MNKEVRVTETRTLEDSLSIIDAAIDASDAEMERRKQFQPRMQYAMMDSMSYAMKYVDWAPKQYRPRGAP